jgi:tRNA (mo5U34)-methyltransferase
MRSDAAVDSNMEISTRDPVRVGIIGVGNCASSFVQGLSYYGNAAANEPVPGLMNCELGGYRVGDIEISSAFDCSDLRQSRCQGPMMPGKLTTDELRGRIEALGPWFHNIELQGVKTAPTHFLGDYPAMKWRRFAHAIPLDLTGRTVLDIGCNAGFYSIEMKRRGAAHVVGIDCDEGYLAQARFAGEVSGFEIEFRKLSVYDVGALGARFDIVLFMGVLYHLRHPLLALDLIHEHVSQDLLVFQSMQRGSRKVAKLKKDYPFLEAEPFNRPEYPKLHFIEHRYAHDPTNWWVPNRACSEAMLRSAGFEITAHPEPEVYICRHVEAAKVAGAVYPARGDQ